MGKKKGNAKERRKDILNYLNMTGGFGVPSSAIKSLAEKFEVSERQIYKDIEKVIQNVAMPEVEKLSKKFALSFEINMRMVHRLVISQDPYVQARGISLLNQTISSFTEFLEKFGLKERVAHLLELSEGGVDKKTFEVYQELAERYIRTFGEQREDEKKLKEILKNKLGKELFEEVYNEIEEKIYCANKLFEVIPARNEDGIIESVIDVVCQTNEQIRRERQKTRMT